MNYRKRKIYRKPPSRQLFVSCLQLAVGVGVVVAVVVRVVVGVRVGVIVVVRVVVKDVVAVGDVKSGSISCVGARGAVYPVVGVVVAVVIVAVGVVVVVGVVVADGVTRRHAGHSGCSHGNTDSDSNNCNQSENGGDDVQNLRHLGVVSSTSSISFKWNTK